MSFADLIEARAKNVKLILTFEFVLKDEQNFFICNCIPLVTKVKLSRGTAIVLLESGKNVCGRVGPNSDFMVPDAFIFRVILNS